MPSTILTRLLIAAAIATTSASGLAAPLRPDPVPKFVLKYDAKRHVYCLREPAITGTRIARVTCKTARRWADAGLAMPTRLLLAEQ